jgi:glycosyltransferase involved in cell wall biosynthesis
MVGILSSQIAALLSRYSGYFHHIKHVPNNELRSLLLQHDVFVLPSLEEGLAISLCEAMACGLPIVATRESGAEEFLADGKSGYFVPAGSADALAQCLEFLHSHRHGLESLGICAARTTQDYLNWPAYTQQLIDVYERVGEI